MNLYEPNRNEYHMYITKASEKVVVVLKYVMEALRRKEALEILPVIRMEIDYELVTLHDAMEANDKVEIIKSKERLKQLRLKMLEIEDE